VVQLEVSKMELNLFVANNFQVLAVNDLDTQRLARTRV
jgi:hypothetical protein